MENFTFTFHVHLPEKLEKFEQPVVIGNVKELGLWEKPIVKLRQPFPQNPTYWRSEPVVISEEKLLIEGDELDDRILDTAKNDQFGIWKNNLGLDQKYQINPNMINDFAFVDYVFNSIKSSNDLKDKIMLYQHLLSHLERPTIRASNLDFICHHVEDILKAKRLFLCLLLGYYIQRQQRQQGNYEHYKLPSSFPSEHLLIAFEDYEQETLPSNIKGQMYTAIITLMQHNAFQMQFDWFIIFKISAEIDPYYTFIDHLKTLKYPNDFLLAMFIERVEDIRSYFEGIELETHVKISKWFIQLCHNRDSIFRLWNNGLLHNNAINKSIFRCFIDRIRENIFHEIEIHFKKFPEAYRDDAIDVFRDHVLFLLENPDREWTKENITAIKRLLHDDKLNWNREEFIQSLELISDSNTLELLQIFPELLDNWFRNDFTDTKEKKIPKICITWFRNLLTKFDTNASKSNGKSSNGNHFVFLVFIHLELLYSLLGNRKNIWQIFTTIAIEEVTKCSEAQIFAAIKLMTQIKQDDVKELFLDMIKEMLNTTVQQINDQLINKIYAICDCTQGKTLDIPNSMSEDILCHIITKLQNQPTVSDPSKYHLDILGASELWNIILRATGNVKKLHSNSFVQHVKMSINELGGLLRDKTIDMQFLQKLLEYSDKTLFQHFDAAVSEKKSIVDVIISQNEIAKLRKLCENYQIQLDVLFKFYTVFCSAVQVTDVNVYIQVMNQHVQSSSKVKLKQVMLSDYWAFHEKILDSAKRCYKFNKSKTFRNIFDACLQEDATATKVEYIAQNLVPIVFEKYNGICEQFKEWENIKCSDASLLWKNVTDINAEFDLMEDCKAYKSQMFVQTLDQLSKIPHWVERLEWLEKVIGLFE
ncbi:hypothetical protein C1645_825615, partial [Glomus cerebriforme]